MPNCKRCKWPFHDHQGGREFCRACESVLDAAIADEDTWRQIGTFLSGAGEATADPDRTAELPRGQSADGLTTPVESPQFPIDDLEF